MMTKANAKKLRRQQARAAHENRDEAELPMEPWRREAYETLVATMERLGRSGPPPYHSVYRNNRYIVLLSTVATTEWGPCEHLWIRRTDDRNEFTWYDLQRIKDDLVGPDRVALEVFPTQAELVDAANMRHLWALPPGKRLPFTITVGAPRG